MSGGVVNLETRILSRMADCGWMQSVGGTLRCFLSNGSVLYAKREDGRNVWGATKLHGERVECHKHVILNDPSVHPCEEAESWVEKERPYVDMPKRVVLRKSSIPSNAVTVHGPGGWQFKIKPNSEGKLYAMAINLFYEGHEECEPTPSVERGIQSILRAAYYIYDVSIEVEGGAK